MSENNTLSAAETDEPSYGRGVVLVLISLLCWVSMNAVGKALVNDYHAVQILFFRNVMTIPALIPFLIAAGGLAALHTKRPWGHAFRALVGILAMGTLIIGLGDLPLSEVIAITYAAPLFMTILSVPFLGEKVDVRRWTAVIIGFVGVLIIVRPDGTTNPMALFVLAGVFCFAMTVIKTRQLSTTEPSAVIVFYSVTAASILTGLALPWFWITPVELLDWSLFIGIGVLGTLSQSTLVMALRAAPVSVIAPLDYLSMVLGIGLDFAIWGVLPGTTTFYGAGIIVTVGLYIIYRDAGPATRRRIGKLIFRWR